jgi:hypothetical protein
MIIMVVLILITVGFVRIIGREQRQVLDRQLSNQAFYAAETGINDAVQQITDLDNPFTGDKTSCLPDGSTFFPTGNNVIDAAAGISYSCLTVDHAPKTLEYNTIDKDETRAIYFTTLKDNDSDGTQTRNIDRIRISWQREVGIPTFVTTAPPTFLPATGSVTNWPANTGVLRVALTPLSPGNYQRDRLIENTFTSFLYPQASGAGSFGSVNYVSGAGNAFQQGPVVSGRCNTSNTPRSCTVEITGLNGHEFLLTLRSMYVKNGVTITANSGGIGAANPVRIGEAQTVVDSTGKSGDVLRRILVRVPGRNSYATPSFTINSAYDICKQYSVGPPEVVGLIPNSAGACTP